MRHRLLNDPVGPLRLACAISTEASSGSDVVRAASAFALAELMLVLSYAAVRVDPKSRLKLRPVFDEAITQIEVLSQALNHDLVANKSLGSYFGAVQQRRLSLLEGADAG
jgi:hypothetical protein